MLSVDKKKQQWTLFGNLLLHDSLWWYSVFQTMLLWNKAYCNTIWIFLLISINAIYHNCTTIYLHNTAVCVNKKVSLQPDYHYIQYSFNYKVMVGSGILTKYHSKCYIDISEFVISRYCCRYIDSKGIVQLILWLHTNVIGNITEENFNGKKFEQL